MNDAISEDETEDPMNTHLSGFGPRVLAAVIVFLAAPFQAASGDILLGYNYGYSRALKETRYDVYVCNGLTGDTRFSTPQLKGCKLFSAQIFFEGSKIGLGLEALRQDYLEVNKSTSLGKESVDYSYRDSFIYMGLSIYYRFFAGKDRKFVPYLSAGLMGLLYLDLFGGGPPDYPDTTEPRLAGGLRYQVLRGLFINSNLSYYPGNSIVSVLVGLEVDL